ncbi:MAG: hypothetical protein GX542_12610 [Rhodococcus sp.]|nr:hypothetical protein [Rhodococcus sp. (in: high G+C Gram-positive bacteria)]
MENLEANTASIAAFGATTASMAAELQAAAVTAAASSPAMLAPVFGIIGGDFLAAFTAVHTAHLASIEKLSGVLTGISSATVAAGAAYSSSDESNAAALNSAGSGVV